MVEESKYGGADHEIDFMEKHTFVHSPRRANRDLV
jgi:hypothetical protein